MIQSTTQYLPKRTLSDLYAHLSSKGKQYILFKDNLDFEKYLINVSKFYYSEISNRGLENISSQLRLDDGIIQAKSDGSS